MKFTKTLAVAALAALPMIASAQLSANVSLVSNYKFRGQDQDLRAGKFTPALQGGFDYAHASGFYVGNWNSTVDWAGNSLESDFYAGYKFEAGGIGFDVGALRYQYPGAAAANTTELYLGLGYGPFSAKYSHTVTDEYFGLTDGKGTGYLNLAYAQEIAPKLTLKASVGFTQFKSAVNNAGIPDYSDYSVGVAYDLGNGFSLGGALVGGSKKNSFLGKADGASVNQNVLVVSITKAM
ncbi:MAG: hypothetical protein J0H69_11940 [Burkholderiales bacterium]|nr:hypothetical protein [Burkholderiales bacterium]